jgi:hypothetical protein
MLLTVSTEPSQLGPMPSRNTSFRSIPCLGIYLPISAWNVVLSTLFGYPFGLYLDSAFTT